MLTPKVKRAPLNNGVPLVSLSLLVFSNSISLLSEASESSSTLQMSSKHSSSSAAKVIAGLMSNKAGSSSGKFHGLTSSAMLAVSVFIGFRIFIQCCFRLFNVKSFVTTIWLVKLRTPND